MLRQDAGKTSGRTHNNMCLELKSPQKLWLQPASIQKVDTHCNIVMQPFARLQLLVEIPVEKKSCEFLSTHGAQQCIVKKPNQEYKLTWSLQTTKRTLSCKHQPSLLSLTTKRVSPFDFQTRVQKFRYLEAAGGLQFTAPKTLK